MTNDELELKLARLATGLVRGFDEVDRITPEPSANHQQKVGLAREAFGEAYAYLNRVETPEPCKVVGCEVDHIGGVIASPELFDRTKQAFREICRCGEYETCAVCLEAHRRFRQVRRPDSLTDHGG